jgi:hypothetical protein
VLLTRGLPKTDPPSNHASHLAKTLNHCFVFKAIFVVSELSRYKSDPGSTQFLVTLADKDVSRRLIIKEMVFDGPFPEIKLTPPS